MKNYFEQVTEILSEFKNLKEYSQFMERLVEKQASGEEMARGMSPNDKSKEQKKDNTFLSKTVSKKADGSAEENHYNEVSPEPEAPPEPPPQPLEPGQQVTIGNKKLDKSLTQPTTVKVDVSGETDKLDMKPTVKKDPNKLPR